MAREGGISSCFITDLGDDSNTVGAIAGGIIGLFYDYDTIPKDWLHAILRREWIESLYIAVKRYNIAQPSRSEAAVLIL